ncbi:MAG TPA: IS21 family transposase [Thermoleophilaceae bacterium]|nr:IS21 family transposase [Thermoleophilaceae bacterium]
MERWAEIRRMRFVERLSIREIARRTGHDRTTVQRAIRADTAPRYVRAPTGSKLDPFKGEIERLLRADPRLPGTRMRELLSELGYAGGKTILDDYPREVRPRYLPRPRTFQRTIYRPGELLQIDLFALSRPVPVGHGQTRKGFVVLTTLGFSRAMAGALVFSKQPPDLLWAICRGIWRLGGLPELLVSDREGALHAGAGRPTEPYARLLGELAVGCLILEPRDCQAKGLIENRGRYLRSSFEPGRVFANQLECQHQLDRWCDEVNTRRHRTLRCRPLDRLAEERRALRELPERRPDTDRRLITRVAPDRHVRVDRNDYSLDPRLVGERVEVKLGQREVVAVALRTGEIAGHRRRAFAGGLTITDPPTSAPSSSCGASAGTAASPRSRSVLSLATTG